MKEGQVFQLAKDGRLTDTQAYVYLREQVPVMLGTLEQHLSMGLTPEAAAAQIMQHRPELQTPESSVVYTRIVLGAARHMEAQKALVGAGGQARDETVFEETLEVKEPEKPVKGNNRFCY